MIVPSISVYRLIFNNYLHKYLFKFIRHEIYEILCGTAHLEMQIL